MQDFSTGIILFSFLVWETHKWIIQLFPIVFYSKELNNCFLKF